MTLDALLSYHESQALQGKGRRTPGVVEVGQEGLEKEEKEKNLMWKEKVRVGD